MRWFAILLVLGLCLYSCGDGGSGQTPLEPVDDMELLSREPGGSVELGRYGPNQEIDQQAIGELYGVLQRMVWLSYQQAIQSGEFRLYGEPQFVNGPGAGHAVVAGTFKGGETDFDFDLESTYFNFSSDSSLFVGGKLRFKGHDWIDTQWNEDFRLNMTVSGVVELGGDYAGRVLFKDLALEWTVATVSSHGELAVLSDDKLFTHAINLQQTH